MICYLWALRLGFNGSLRMFKRKINIYFWNYSIIHESRQVSRSACGLVSSFVREMGAGIWLTIAQIEKRLNHDIRAKWSTRIFRLS